MRINLGSPSPKQKLFLEDTHRYVAYGGARGGGKSWAVRVKAILLCLFWGGIKILIVRQSYKELMNNHILPLLSILGGIAKYNRSDKMFTFPNGSTITFGYCANDSDLGQYQGAEYDVIFIDEACLLSEYQIKSISACNRGVNKFPKRIYYTLNPGGQSHGYFKRLFIDRHYESAENPDNYSFIQSLVTDNYALMREQPEYLEQLKTLPPKLREAWLNGRWDIFEGMFFEDFRTEVDVAAAAEIGLTPEQALEEHRFTHVIEPFEPDLNWTYYRSYDYGYGKPFSCCWWAVDYDGTAYQIEELYGCTDTPNEGVKWTPDKQFSRIREIEEEHPYLKGRKIYGVADPSIWDGSRGESVNDAALRNYIEFSKGINARIPGWMQMHYRFMFDKVGRAKMYIFNNCKNTIRTLPLMMFDEHKPEDLDTTLEDHIADAIRYFCMARPITPEKKIVGGRKIAFDPLNLLKTEVA
jgi:phage terminase large subunit